MSGFLNDLGLKDAPADPNFIPEGKYPAFVSKLQIRDVAAKANKPAFKALTITYKISDLDEENVGKIKTEFKTLPKVNPDGTYADEDSKKHASYLKQRLLSLGVPESELDSMQESDILGTPVWIVVKQTGEYYNIVAVELREEVQQAGLL